MREVGQGSIKVAVVTPDLEQGGGVATVVDCFIAALERSTRFVPTVVSLATSRADPLSVRLASPATWRRGIQVTERRRDSYSYLHVGAHLAELEFCRYRPRRVLVDLLAEFDLIQVVAGFPAWARPVLGIDRPIALQFATTVRLERASRLAREPFPRRTWTKLMTMAAARAERKALQGCDLILVENRRMLSFARQESRAEVLFLPPTVDLGRFKEHEEEGDRELLLSVGRFSDARKNVRLLFEAYSLVRKANPEAPRLVLAGDPPTSEDLAYMHALGIGEYVDVAGWVSDEDLQSLYKRSLLFILSSDEEGLGMVLIEAMATGVPIVSTATEGAQVVVKPGTTGILTPVNQAAPMAEAIDRLLRDPAARTRMASSAVLAVEQEFSLERFSDDLESAYLKLLGAARTN